MRNAELPANDTSSLEINIKLETITMMITMDTITPGILTCPI
jgi:hypothetical protein